MLLQSKHLIHLTLILLLITTLPCTKLFGQTLSENKALQQLFDNYYEERLMLFPIEATYLGDTRYNDLLPNNGSESFLKAQHDFYTKYQHELKTYNYQQLDKQDKISYDILMDIINRNLGAEKFHQEYMPVTQVFSIPLTMGQLGSGTGAQPFKTVKDYEDWLKRISAFAVWTDTAIADFGKGVKAGIVLPKALVVKMIPQMESLAQTDTSKSIFYGPVRSFPKNFPASDKVRLSSAYNTAITDQLIPAYQKLKNFFSNEYLPEARTTSGINALPDGKEMYQFYIYDNTTTHKTPQEVYQTGLNEVARITV